MNEPKVKWLDKLVQMGGLYWSNMVTGDNIQISKQEITKTLKGKTRKPRTKTEIVWRVQGQRPSDGQWCHQDFKTLAKAQAYAQRCADFINDYYSKKNRCAKETDND